jgi:uncharacterized protein
MTPIDFQTESFNPPRWLRNPHIQTLIGSYLRRTSGLSHRRMRLNTPDEDFIDLDLIDVDGATWAQLGDHAPILLFLHGLEGNALKGYAIDLYKVAARAGFRPVGINHRSCSGQMNRQARFYHMGATADVALAINWLGAQYPDVELYMVGVSLGANMTLKYLGERTPAEQARVTAAAAISPPFVMTGWQTINQGIGRIYGYYLLSSLKQKVRQKADLLTGGRADPYRALTAYTLREFDEAITAPLHGFRDADDYYGSSHSINFLATVRVPTLLLRAQDDPFFNSDIPHKTIAGNDCLHGVFPAHGGHVGFIEGAHHKQTRWAQRQVLRFFQAVQQAGIA